MTMCKGELNTMETKVSVFDNELFQSTLTTYLVDGVVSYHEAVFEEHGDDRLITEPFKVFDEGSDFVMYVANLQKKLELMKVCREFVTEMEGYSYYGSNPGIPEDDIEDMCEKIMSKFFIK